jgi:NADPH-ferrihemoprotein reductase
MLHIFIWYKATYYNLFSTFVCSDARNMARDVHNIVLKVVQEKGGMTESQALAYVKKMEAQKRYSADVWS